MLAVFRNETYARLFSAQVIALLGTGLLTVALGLLAYDLAGDRAGQVLGTAFAIKMIAYVGLSPVAAALVQHLPRKPVLIGADLIRAAVALCLPFIDAVWQVYALIFVLQAASATFTPAFQAVIPDVLPDEADYTRALSLSRLAYDLENLISPALAGALLLLVSFHWLFLGTVVGFLGSALLVWRAAVPGATAAPPRPFRERLTRGTRIYLATPRLRGLLALNMGVAAAGAFVLVNTVVLVRAGYGGSEVAVAQALAAFGAGSMAVALLLPRLLERLEDRSVMLGAGAALALLTLGHGGWLVAGGSVGWGPFLGLWLLTGAGYAAVLTPSGRLLRASSQSEDRPALFAAQFALSHACWLLTYPFAGWAGVVIGLHATLLALGLVAAISEAVALRVWPPAAAELPHDHPDLAPDHPHLRENPARHAHVFVIDDQHRRWPHPA
ncbi:MFS transporter [Rhodobacter ferrooxidans]|uniref:Major facilitator superfamily MFS_1 n=1 Tax=Rhodobacter ferrooxidans TaxID=371731 RepID=C8RW66_9RHOB|nr:MFS transporter [Rhodobacter sp. SW2]EEW26809.1 major facilitator superfamily MFS_1 [Rhodobacter sp. SW2]